jgi:Uma2 family endonuclease
VEEYLAWSDSQSERPRTELINGQVVAMATERAAHNRIKIAVIIALDRAIRSGHAPCEAFTDGIVVRVDEHTAYEPDALVNGGERMPAQNMIAPQPVIIAEVLSSMTRHTDTSAKLIGYFKLPTVAHYLVIDPESRSLTHHRRSGPPVQRQSGPLRLDPPGLDLTIEELLGPA